MRSGQKKHKHHVAEVQMSVHSRLRFVVPPAEAGVHSGVSPFRGYAPGEMLLDDAN